MDDTKIKPEDASDKLEEKDAIKEETKPKYFKCENCNFREKYDYYGFEPPFFRKYKLKEESYVIEDPFVPPKQGEIIVLGAHCIKCGKKVCRDTHCSFYFNGTYCIPCSKSNVQSFPASVREKLNKIVI